MTDAKEIKNSEQHALSRESSAPPSFGQGGGEKCRGDGASKSAGTMPCVSGWAEYINIRKKPAAKQQRGRGRPAVMVPEIKKFLCLLLSLGFSRRPAAAHAGLDNSTITRAAQRDPKFHEEIQEALALRAVRPQVDFTGRWWMRAARE